VKISLSTKVDILGINYNIILVDTTRERIIFYTDFKIYSYNNGMRRLSLKFKFILNNWSLKEKYPSHKGYFKPNKWLACAPGGTRTPNPLIRSYALLCP